MPYYYYGASTAAVRAMNVVFQRTNDDASYEITDAEITQVCTAFAQPRINRVLRRAGFTVPFTADDETIIEVACKLITAAFFGGWVARFSGREPELAKTLLDDAKATLKAIAKGDEEISHARTTSSRHLVWDASPSVRPDSQTFTDDAELSHIDWQFEGETRESDA